MCLSLLATRVTLCYWSQRSGVRWKQEFKMAAGGRDRLECQEFSTSSLFLLQTALSKPFKFIFESKLNYEFNSESKTNSKS